MLGPYLVELFEKKLGGVALESYFLLSVLQATLSPFLECQQITWVPLLGLRPTLRSRGSQTDAPRWTCCYEELYKFLDAPDHSCFYDPCMQMKRIYWLTL